MICVSALKVFLVVDEWYPFVYVYDVLHKSNPVHDSFLARTEPSQSVIGVWYFHEDRFVFMDSQNDVWWVGGNDFIMGFLDVLNNAATVLGVDHSSASAEKLFRRNFFQLLEQTSHTVGNIDSALGLKELWHNSAGQCVHFSASWAVDSFLRRGFGLRWTLVEIDWLESLGLTNEVRGRDAFKLLALLKTVADKGLGRVDSHLTVATIELPLFAHLLIVWNEQEVIPLNWFPTDLNWFPTDLNWLSTDLSVNPHLTNLMDHLSFLPS